MRVGTTTNEHGTPVAQHICDTCGQPFGVIPADANYGGSCCIAPCPSYDIERDVDYLMLDHELIREDLKGED